MRKLSNDVIEKGKTLHEIFKLTNSSLRFDGIS